MQLNMPVEINITDDDIVYAERVLLSKEQEFDEERKILKQLICKPYRAVAKQPHCWPNY